MDDLDIFKQYLKAIENKSIHFIVISSGTSGKDVIPICKNYSFIKEINIFCANYEYNKHYIKEYLGYVNKVFTSTDSVFLVKKYKDGIKKSIKIKSFYFTFRIYKNELTIRTMSCYICL